MASVRKEIMIDVSPDDAWAALRDWGALHQRLVPGFVTDARLEGRDRIITFFDGTVVRERLVDLDDDSRRLVWSTVDGAYAHYNAAAQILASSDGGTRFVWIADLLPDEAAERTGDMMEKGISVAKETLERG
jgi:Polyketide cyclase / dehydrase and lipid transport